MKEAATITSKIHEESDAKLKSEIDAIIDPVKGLIRKVSVREVSTATAPSVNVWAALDAFAEAVFQEWHVNRRSKAVDEFIAKVADLEAQVEQISSYTH